MVVRGSFILGKRQGLLRCMDFYFIPVSPLRLAHTDIYCLLYWLCAWILLLRRKRISPIKTYSILLALLVTKSGTPIHRLEGHAKRETLRNDWASQLHPWEKVLGLIATRAGAFLFCFFCFAFAVMCAWYFLQRSHFFFKGEKRKYRGCRLSFPLFLQSMQAKQGWLIQNNNTNKTNKLKKASNKDFFFIE